MILSGNRDALNPILEFDPRLSSPSCVWATRSIMCRKAPCGWCSPRSGDSLLGEPITERSRPRARRGPADCIRRASGGDRGAASRPAEVAFAVNARLTPARCISSTRRRSTCGPARAAPARSASAAKSSSSSAVPTAATAARAATSSSRRCRASIRSSTSATRSTSGPSAAPAAPDRTGPARTLPTSSSRFRSERRSLPTTRIAACSPT